MNQQDDDLPKVSMDEDFRGREKRGAAPEQFEPEDDMPAVNRKKVGSKIGNSIMLFVVGAVGLALIYAVNSGDKKEKQAATQKQEAVVSNNLPPFREPSAPPPPPPPPATVAETGASALVEKPPRGGFGGTQRGPDGKPALHWTDRKLAGDLIVNESGGRSGGVEARRGGQVPDYSKIQSQGSGNLSLKGDSQKDGLSVRLTPTDMVGVSASILPDRNFIITKGTSLDCALETAIDTTLPGIITCRLTRDVYSDNGQVLLMDRGTQLVGEQQGNVKRGQARVFALWSRAKTPNGVIINLNSPGADALGRSGLEGWVDNHFADRFGAAILMSFIQTSLDVIADKNSGNYEGAYVNEASDQTGEIVSKILDSTINIPPTIIKNQGDHINIMVARDLDFSGVYGLEVGS